VNWRRSLALPGETLQQRFELVEAGDLTWQLGEGVPARGEHLERRPVGGDIDPERTDDAQLLVDDVVGLEIRRARPPRVPATTTVPPGRASAIA
jgi:hypothetical protein